MTIGADTRSGPRRLPRALTVALLAAAAALLAALLPAAAPAATNNIFTVAGTSNGLSGDTGPASAPQLNTPTGVAATADGGYLIADAFNHRIRRVSPAGVITTVAGTTNGLSGDTGPASAAQLDNPRGVAATADGGFLIADENNHRIRYVDADLRSPKGDTGATGAQGATGPTGASGTQGPAGTDRDLLAAAIAADKTTSKQRKVKIRIVTTLAGEATLEAKPKTGKKAGRAAKVKTRTTIKPLGGEGRHQIKLERLKRGTTYTLTLSVASADGQQATDSAKLKVKKKR